MSTPPPPTEEVAAAPEELIEVYVRPDQVNGAHYFYAKPNQRGEGWDEIVVGARAPSGAYKHLNRIAVINFLSQEGVPAPLLGGRRLRLHFKRDGELASFEDADAPPAEGAQSKG
jgi:hypothetical protein